MGMSNDAHDVDSLIRLVRWIKQVTPGGAYVFAGTPSHWRTKDGDCDTRPEFDALWAEVDCVSPFSAPRLSTWLTSANRSRPGTSADSAMSKMRTTSEDGFAMTWLWCSTTTREWDQEEIMRLSW